MNYIHILDDIINEISPDHLSPEYITYAKVVDLEGVERELRGDDLVAFMRDPRRAHMVMQARVMLNVSKLRRDMLENIVKFFENLERGVKSLPPVMDDTI